MSNNKLAVLGDVERRLAAVKTVDEAKSIRDQAEAIRVYAKSARVGLEIQNHAAFVKIQAERRAGELLATMEKANHRPKKGDSVSPYRESLNGNALDERTAQRWQTMAKAPEAEVRRLSAEATEHQQELSSAAIYRAGRGESVHFSSDTDEWATPQDLFDVLNAEFHFTLDVCASAANAKVERYFSPSRDGLSQRWEGSCWMNPPYGDVIPAWIEKAFKSAKEERASVVCLVPARVDTAWWWDFCRYGEIRFLRGRLKFGGSANSAPFPSAVVIFPRLPKVVWWEWATA